MDSGLQAALIGLGGALVGGPVWTALVGWLKIGAAQRKSETDRLRLDHEKCEARVAALEKRLEAVEHHHASLVPRWIKDSAKRVTWINGAAMLAIFGPLGKSRDEVEGHVFADLLDMEASREIDRLDRSALARPGTAISTLLKLHLSLPAMHIVKVAGVGRDGELIYEGYAYCVNDSADAMDRGVRRQEEQLGLSTLRLQGPPEDETPPPELAS